MHRILFRLGLCPGLCLQSLQRSPDPYLDLRGPTTKGRERKGVVKRRELNLAFLDLVPHSFLRICVHAIV